MKKLLSDEGDKENGPAPHGVGLEGSREIQRSSVQPRRPTARVPPAPRSAARSDDVPIGPDVCQLTPTGGLKRHALLAILAVATGRRDGLLVESFVPGTVAFRWLASMKWGTR